MSIENAGGASRPFYKRRWFLISVSVVVLLLIIGSLDKKPPPKKGGSASNLGSDAGAVTSNTGDEDNLSGPGAPTVAGPVVAAGSGSEPGPSACRSGDPLANVYHPNRLKVLTPCTTVTGVVRSVRHEDDGDVHFDVALDPPFRHLLTHANYAAQHGWLVVEIVPADEPGCTPGQPPKPATGTYNYGICTGADETPPRIGAQVVVTGPSVLDEDHGGWAEVHPAWAISETLLRTPTTATTTTTSPPQPTFVASPPTPEVSTPEPPVTSPPATEPPPTAPPPTEPPTTAPSSGGAWCSASAAPSNDGYPGDYDVYIHSNQPDMEATATDAGDSHHDETDSTGYVDIRLWNTSPGEEIAVTVNGATCSTAA